MKRNSIAIGLFAVALALPLAADEKKEKAETKKPAAESSEETKADPKAARKISTDRTETESALVRAARLARESRSEGKRAAVSITDDDVRSTTGRLTVGNYAGPPSDAPAAEAGDILRKMESDRDRAAKEAVAAARRVQELEEEVARLERAASLLEDDYYHNSDSSDEMDGLQAAYLQSRVALEAKREELARARQDLEAKRSAASNVVTP